jgi:hypothetical protein
MAAGLTDRVWTVDDIVTMMDPETLASSSRATDGSLCQTFTSDTSVRTAARS